MKIQMNNPRYRQIENAPLNRAIKNEHGVCNRTEQHPAAEDERSALKELLAPGILPVLRTRYWLFGVDCTMELLLLA